MSRTPALHLVSRFGLTILLALLLTAVNDSLPARGSAATPLKSTEITFTDPPADAASVLAADGVNHVHLPEFDIVSGDIVQDRPNGVVRASIQMAGPSTGGSAILRIALGLTDAYGDCSIYADAGGQPDAVVVPNYIRDGTTDMETMLDDEPIPGPAAAPAPVPAFVVVGAPSLISVPVTKTHVDGTITLNTGVSPYFSQHGWDCAYVVVERVNTRTNRRDPLDDALAFAPVDQTPTIAAAPTPIGSATAQALDADGDGVPDVSDVCPQVAGAATNGCLSTTIAHSVLLGTKRVVFDRLIPRTGSACPAAATVTATLKGKKLGSGRVGVLQHSKWCQVKGVLKLKKKVSKARVTVKGTGMASLAITVAKT